MRSHLLVTTGLDPVVDAETPRSAVIRRAARRHGLPFKPGNDAEAMLLTGIRASFPWVGSQSPLNQL
jgi:hypothetical protein